MKKATCGVAFCGLDRIQTCNLLIRSQMLYSVELRNHFALRPANIIRFLISQKQLQKSLMRPVFSMFR